MNVEGQRRKRRSKGKGGQKKRAKTAASKKTPSPPPAPPAALVPAEVGSRENEGDVINSFDAAYVDIIKGLPEILQPTSTRHGKHSYTVYLS